MNQRLTESERVLLSTYLDNELATADVERAESLLASSSEAQNYLRELRAVGNLSAEALALPVGLAATAATTMKLTGPAIATAAKGVSLTKGSFLGVWGITGLVGAAATAVVAVTIVLSGGGGADLSRDGGEYAAERGRSAVAQTIPTALALDSNALIVPEMTPNEMVAFAVDGTLPIDEARSCFITLVTKGKDSLSVEIHNRPPQGMIGIIHDIERLRPAEYRGIDSLARTLRLALLQGKDGGTVVRRDIGRLRLEVAQLLGRVPSSEIPAAVQLRIRRAEHLLARTFASGGSSFEESNDVDITNQGAPLYVSLQGGEDTFLSGIPNAPPPLHELTVVFNSTPRYCIAPVQMNELRTLASAPRVSVTTTAVSSNDVPEVQIGAGEAPRSRRRRQPMELLVGTKTPPEPETTNENGLSLARPDEQARVYQMQLQRATDKLKRAEERIDAVDEKLRRVEEENQESGRP